MVVHHYDSINEEVYIMPTTSNNRNYDCSLNSVIINRHKSKYVTFKSSFILSKTFEAILRAFLWGCHFAFKVKKNGPRVKN